MNPGRELIKKKTMKNKVDFTPAGTLFSLNLSPIVALSGRDYELNPLWILKRKALMQPTKEGPGCPSVYDAGLTNQTSFVRFPSPLNFS